MSVFVLLIKKKSMGINNNEDLTFANHIKAFSMSSLTDASKASYEIKLND